MSDHMIQKADDQIESGLNDRKELENKIDDLERALLISERRLEVRLGCEEAQLSSSQEAAHYNYLDDKIHEQDQLIMNLETELAAEKAKLKIAMEALKYISMGLELDNPEWKPSTYAEGILNDLNKDT